MAENPLQPEQVDTGPPVETLVTIPQTVPDDTVRVSTGNCILDDDITIFPLAAASSGAFGALPAAPPGLVNRWDLLTVDLTGAFPVLAITTGLQSTSVLPFEASIPKIPLGHFALAAVRVTEVTPSPVIISPDDIEDVRGFFARAQHSSVGIAYAPATPANWDVVPTETKGALDEIADRLTTAVSPLDTHPTTASVGTDRDAARADHVHSHADLSGSVTTHHDTVQIENTQTTTADWLVGDGSNVQAHLDEVGSRLNTSIAISPVHPTTGAVGTSLEAAHADHVHTHDDLSGTATTHHDTVQSVHTQDVPANWTTTDGGNVKLHLDELAARTITAVAPTGSLMAYAGSSVPSGWVFCDGSSQDSIADTTLAPLFALIGTTYGGAGASDFNVPDLRGRIPIGVGTGDEILGYSVEEFFATSLIQLEAGAGDVTNDFFPGRKFQTSGASNGANNGTFTVASVEFTGGSTEITIVEVSLVNEGSSPATLDTADLSARVLADEGGNEQHRLTEAELAAHTHNYDQVFTADVDGSGFTILRGINANASVTTSTGDDEHHNNIQPFLALNFIIKK